MANGFKNGVKSSVPKLDFEFKPADVILFDVQYPFGLSSLAKLFIRYGHVGMFWLYTKKGNPLMMESIGRGVLIRSVFNYTKRKMYVYRPRIPLELAEAVADAGENIADDPDSYYGFVDIPRFALPKLILYKLNEKLPDWMKFPEKWLDSLYRKNNVFICSEFVAQAYRNAGIDLHIHGIPLPDDFAKDALFEYVGEVSFK